MKTVGGLRKTRYRGRERVQLHTPIWVPPLTICSESHGPRTAQREVSENSKS